MDYREYRKKYGSGQSGNTPEEGEKLTPSSEKYKNGGGAATNTGTVTRHYRSVGAKKKKYGARSKKSAAAKGVIAAIIGVTLLLILTVCLALFTNRSIRVPNYVARKLLVEAGRGSIQASDFLKDKSHTAEFAEGTAYSLNQVGEYSVDLVIDGSETCTVTLLVQDTVPPSARPKQAYVRRGYTLPPNQCVSYVQDATDVTVTFDKTYSFTELGAAKVGVVLTDAGGNVTTIHTTVNVVEENTDVLTYTVDLEVGSPFPSVMEFVGDGGHGAFTGDTSTVDTSKTGKIGMGLTVDGKSYTVYVNVVDTVPPDGTVVPVIFYNDKYPTADRFFSSINDKTEVSASYVTQPNWNAGDQIPVKLLLTDAGGNKKEFESTASRRTDNEPPVLSLTKTLFQYTVGDGSLLWRAAVSATDNSGEEVALSMEYSPSYLVTPGMYTAYVVAKDKAGNETRKPVSLEVTDRTITLDMLNNYIKPIVDSLKLETMNQTQQAYKIQKSLEANNTSVIMRYTDESPHDDWIRQAYLCLSGERQGDCFVFASVAQAIFRYLGYETVMVHKSEEAVRASGGAHYWVLVNFNKDDPTHDHWYHFDGCPQTGAVRDGAFYMMTTTQLKTFTEWRDVKLNHVWRYYEFDEAAYPASETKVAVPFSNKELKSYMAAHGLKE